MIVTEMQNNQIPTFLVMQYALGYVRQDKQANFLIEPKIMFIWISEFMKHIRSLNQPCMKTLSR